MMGPVLAGELPLPAAIHPASSRVISNAGVGPDSQLLPCGVPVLVTDSGGIC